MAQREIPVAGVVPQVGDNGETGYQLDVGGGTTLPFTEEDLKKQGYKLSADKGSVLKADIVITGNLSTEGKQGAPVGETAEGKVDVIQPEPQQVVQPQAAPIEQVAETPVQPAPVEQPAPTPEQAQAPIGVPSDADLLFAEAASQPPVTAGFGNVTKIVDDAIASTAEVVDAVTEPVAEVFTGDPEESLKPEKERIGEGRPLLMPRTDVPPDYYTRMFFTDIKNPEDPAEPSQQFTLRVHNNFRNAVGFRKPYYDTDTRKFARDADGYIQVDKREFQMVEFESEDLDERTAQFIREGGYALQMSETLENEDGTLNLTYPGDVLDEELLQRSQEFSLLVNNPIYRYMTEEGGQTRAREILEANGVPLAEQVYNLRRLEDSPFFAGKDLPRVSYLLDNAYGGVLSLASLAPDQAVDQSVFLMTWTAALMSEIPEVAMSLLRGEEAHTPITDTVFLTDNEELDAQMAKAIRETRAVIKTSPLIRWAVDAGWDATQRYAEDHGLTYEQARAALTQNRGLAELVNWFTMETLGFAGPINAFRASGGKKLADSVDEYILSTYGDEIDRKLYNSVGTRPMSQGGSRQAVQRKRFDIIQNIIARQGDEVGATMAEISAGYRQSVQFQALSKFQQRTAEAFWFREGYLAQRPTVMSLYKELVKDRRKALKDYKKLLSRRDIDPTERNKARSKLLKLNQEIAVIKAQAALPVELASLTKGELTATLAGASGYAIAQELTDNATAQDFGTFLALAGIFTPQVSGVLKDAGYGVVSLLYTVPGVKQIMDNRGIAPPPKAIYDAKKTLREIADPQVAALVQTNLQSIGQSIIRAEEVNERAGRQIIDTGLLIGGLASMSGLSRIDAAVSGITANPKMGEIAEFGQEVTDITKNAVKRMSIRDQMAEALLTLRQQVADAPEGSANWLQEELDVMEAFIKRQDKIIQAELGAQKELFQQFGALVEDALLGSSARYEGTELDRLAQEAVEEGRQLDIMNLIDRVLSKDALMAAGMTEDQAARASRLTGPFQQYLATTQEGLDMLNGMFNKGLSQLSEFREQLPEGIANFGVNWTIGQYKISQKNFLDGYNALDAKFEDHRMPMTTPISYTNDAGETITAPSILEYLESGDFYLAGATDDIVGLVGGKKVDPSVAAVHGLLEEGSNATLDNLRKNFDGADDAFNSFLQDENARRLAAEEPLLDPTKMTGLDKWKMMGEALVEFGLVKNFQEYATQYGRIGMRTKDYRLLISHLGARGAAAKGFAQYSHHELRHQFVKRADAFESNFFDVNLSGGTVAAQGNKEFNTALKALNENYSTGHLNVYRNDPLLRRLITDIENGQDFKSETFFETLTKRYRLDQDDANISGFQEFWARIGGVRNKEGEFVIDLDTDSGKQIQSLVRNWGMSLLADTVAGKRALAIRYNAAQDVRAMVYAGQYAGDPRGLAGATGFMLPKDVPELQEAYQKDLPFQELVVLENLKGVVTVDGVKQEVPLININHVLQPIMPESVEGGRVSELYNAVRGVNQSRVKAAIEAKRVVRQEAQLLDDVSTDAGRELDMTLRLFDDLGKGLKPEQARAKIVDLIAAGPGGADRLLRFRKLYLQKERAKLLEKNPNATGAELIELENSVSTGFDNMLSNIVIDYLFEQSATAGAQTTLTQATGDFISANPAVIDGKVLFEILGLETRGGGISDRGINFQQFFERLGKQDILDELKFYANNLFEAGPDGNIRISNLPTPINLNHVATRVVAGLRGQVSPRWLIIEHVLRQRSIKAGEMFMTMMTDPEVGEALIELATKKDLTPKDIERNIDVLWRITRHAARTEAVEQHFLPALENISEAASDFTAPPDGDESP